VALLLSEKAVSAPVHLPKVAELAAPQELLVVVSREPQPSWEIGSELLMAPRRRSTKQPVPMGAEPRTEKEMREKAPAPENRGPGDSPLRQGAA